MLTWAFAGVNGAVTTVAVERKAAAARDVIAKRFNMTCLHLSARPRKAVRAHGRYYAADPRGVSGRPEEFSRLFRRFSAMVRFPLGDRSARSAGFRPENREEWTRSPTGTAPGTRAIPPSWARATTPSGWARWCSTAAAPSRAAARTSTSMRNASFARRAPWD